MEGEIYYFREYLGAGMIVTILLGFGIWVFYDLIMDKLNNKE